MLIKMARPKTNCTYTFTKCTLFSEMVKNGAFVFFLMKNVMNTFWEEQLEQGVLAVVHEPGEVALQAVVVFGQKALDTVRHRAGKMFYPEQKEFD